MNIYGGYHDYSLYLFDLGASDPTLIHPLARTIGFFDDSGGDDLSSSNITRKIRAESSSMSSPPKHRHDGASPLPLGMDWSPPPRNWEGRTSVWPHDFHTGWSYCVSVPSWTIIPKPRGLEPIVFYRVQVGIQSPEGITTSRWIIRRFNDFLKLSSDLKTEFPKKKLPPAPSKGLLRMKSKNLIEERRCSLGDWIEKLLSDIDISRSVTVANFLELEAAARSSFYVANENALDETFSTGFVAPSEDMLNDIDGSLVAVSSFTSDNDTDSHYEASDLGTPRGKMKSYSELGLDNATHNPELPNALVAGIKDGLLADNDVRPSKESVQEIGENQGEITRVSSGSLESEISASKPEVLQANSSSRLEIFPRDMSIIVPTEDQNKMNRILTTMQQRITTARTDVEELVTRLNQELAVRQFLSTKVQDLETELETMKLTREESLQQVMVVEKERVTQVQWDMEELRRKCMEMELKLQSEQEEKALLDSIKKSITLDNDKLRQELDASREQVALMLKRYEDMDLKSKLDLKTLAKEVKSLRSSQSELRQKLAKLTSEKVEVERTLQEEKERMKHSDAVTAKLLYECEILRSRLEECSTPFVIEEKNKLAIDTSSPSEANDLLSIADNRIGLLLAEAQLLARDVAKVSTSPSSNVDGGHGGSLDEEIRKMLTNVLVDNASLRIQLNSIIRCAISAGEYEKDAEETSSRDSLLGRFLDR